MKQIKLILTTIILIVLMIAIIYSSTTIYSLPSNLSQKQIILYSECKKILTFSLIGLAIFWLVNEFKN